MLKRLKVYFLARLVPAPFGSGAWLASGSFLSDYVQRLREVKDETSRSQAKSQNKNTSGLVLQLCRWSVTFVTCQPMLKWMLKAWKSYKYRFTPWQAVNARQRAVTEKNQLGHLPKCDSNLGKKMVSTSTLKPP